MRRREWLAAAAALPAYGCAPALAPVEGGFAGPSPERGHLLRATRVGAPSQVRRARLVIAGGGIAGLAAARALRLAGVDDFVLLELEDESGGNSRAGRLAGLDCPLGAHYLPVPGDGAHHVQDLLEEMGLRRRISGRWTYDERHLCHSPQERLYFRGEWQEGLLPAHGIGAPTQAQYVKFARLVDRASREARYSMPAGTTTAPAHLALDAIPFAEWLGREGLDDEHLLWYLDYCCRDDYGAGIAAVSAWAGLHYFASRHGFHPPGEEGERDAVLTWPQGNAYLARGLAAPLGARLHASRVVTRIEAVRGGMQVDAVDPLSGVAERWDALHVVVALPVFVAARVLASPPYFVMQAARATRHAPWVVANLQIREPLRDRPGAAPSWDNVPYGSAGLGYVDAGHQRLDPRPAPTVLTWYLAPGESARAQLLSAPWTHWRDLAAAELAAPHPDLPGKLQRVLVARYGHAMATPVPGTRARLRAVPLHGRAMSFAHSDWAGYSVFEEAFTLGHEAGVAAARAVGARVPARLT
ncbi:FAD-dependent oxidoreductase [Ramlibacter humi]|uniref:FAD-binding protein n=1 Tax=Ramlibacter humi TaxID=2530451 RepID=A0A4Z0BSG5_9BURK|nr:FAD-dependent oxidoreductase [Ramlibacter humi]TFZ01781.1 FAD-binding protein [Ramlibacter humi]